MATRLNIRRSEMAAGGDGGLMTPEREELSRQRCENRKLKEEREILSKAASCDCLLRMWCPSYRSF
jgi:hypothetical protein